MNSARAIKPERKRLKPNKLGARAVSVQSAGGPRLGGRPLISAAKSNGKSMPATCSPGWLGKVCALKDGKTRANEPHMSQCDPAGTASPAALLAVFTRQTPPSLPVRTSSASIEAGATSADNTATKLRKAATRLHKGRVEGNDGRLDTARIIETQAAPRPIQPFI